MIHTCWLQKLTAFHEDLVAQMNQLLTSGSHPHWLTQSGTILIMKDPHKVQHLQLPADSLPHNMEGLGMSQYMCEAQTDLETTPEGQNSSCWLVELLHKVLRPDRPTRALQDWIDYKKAYDSVLHTQDTGVFGTIQDQQDADSLHQELSAAVENRGAPPGPSWPEPPQSDHSKEWSYHQPPPLHGRHQAARQE